MDDGAGAPTVKAASGEGEMFAREYAAQDLVLFVWPPRTGSDPPARGAASRNEAASSSWAMEAAKAERVRVLVSVFEDTIVGAWRVTGSVSTLTQPAGKSRRVNRATFSTVDDPRLHYLWGQPSQVRRRRNPQTTIELRDLWGAQTLLQSEGATPGFGVARIGDFTLTVRQDGTADLLYPARSPVTLRPEPAGGGRPSVGARRDLDRTAVEVTRDEDDPTRRVG